MEEIKIIAYDAWSEKPLEQLGWTYLRVIPQVGQEVYVYGKKKHIEALKWMEYNKVFAYIGE